MTKRGTEVWAAISSAVIAFFLVLAVGTVASAEDQYCGSGSLGLYSNGDWDWHGDETGDWVDESITDGTIWWACDNDLPWDDVDGIIATVCCMDCWGGEPEDDQWVEFCYWDLDRTPYLWTCSLIDTEYYCEDGCDTGVFNDEFGIREEGDLDGWEYGYGTRISKFVFYEYRDIVYTVYISRGHAGVCDWI